MPSKASMAPPFHFTTPVLSVAADAVRELQGGDALSSLWTLFTKCKESLHDGRRLENMSWRLWYREMATMSRRGDNDYLNEKVDEGIPTDDVLADRPRRGSFVGRIIVDMLLVQQQPSSFGGTPVSTASRPTHCQLPTPATSDDNPSALPTPATEHEPISPHLPSIQLFLDAPPPPPPRLVVVNPTPGPTPRPTPPTTPILSALLPNGNANGNGNEARRFGNKLLPLPMPMPVLGIPVPTIPISGSSGSSSGRNAVSSSLSSSKSGSGSLSSPTNPDAPISPITAFTAATTTDFEMGKISGPGPSTRTRPGHMRRTSSASSSGRVTAAGAKDKSRSRSRDGAAGLVMTSTKRGGKTRVGPVRRTSSGRAGVTAGGSTVVMRRTASNKKDERKPTFNIGSNSDEGSAAASKSAGSGSSRSRMGVQPVPEEPFPLPPPQRVSPPPPLPPVPPTLSSQHPLPHPSAVIPQLLQRRTTIVLATSESDYETESESESEDRSRGDAEGGVGKDDEDGDWSSEEDVSTGDVDVVVRRDPPAPHQHTNHQEDRHQLQLPTAPAVMATTRTTSQAQVRPPTQNQHPTRGHLHPHPPLSRAQQQRQVQAARAAHVVEQAALEAERQREMFVKKQVPSAEELLGKRTRSVGLLSQLMNPDPQIFPVNHPYRRGFSSGEIRGGMGVLGMTKTTADASRDVGMNKKESGERREPGGPAPPLIAPGMRTNKSSAAMPVASQVQVGSAVPGGSGMKNGVGSGGYRPKGRPAGQEMEDDSDSDGDGEAQNAMLLSKSVAQAKLKALAAKRGIITHQQPEKRDAIQEEEDPVPRWVRERSSAGQSNGRVMHAGAAAAIPRHQYPTPNPIPVGHPYNLPPPTAPSTPRTTRRLMLQTEMSESLRRNLLWERQVSKVNLAGVRRTASASGQTVLGGVKPLTMAPSIVQLTAKKAGAARGEVHGPAGPPDGRVEGPEEREERRKQALARNRSWAADDYHYNGW